MKRWMVGLALGVASVSVACSGDTGMKGGNAKRPSAATPAPGASGAGDGDGNGNGDDAAGGETAGKSLGSGGKGDSGSSAASGDIGDDAQVSNASVQDDAPASGVPLGGDASTSNGSPTTSASDDPGTIAAPIYVADGAGLPVLNMPAPRATGPIGFAAGAGNGGGPVLLEKHGNGLGQEKRVMVYDAAFRGGMRVAMARSKAGDVFVATAAGAGGAAHVRVFVNDALIANFFAYEESFRGGAYVALGDLNADGYPDLVTGAGGGGSSRVRAFDLKTGAILHDFIAFEGDFRGGARVAAGDLNDDGIAEIAVAAGPGGGPLVSVYEGRSGNKLSHFFAWPDEASSYRGGLHVAIGKFASGKAIVVGAGSPGEEDYPGYSAPGDAGAPRISVLRLDGSHVLDRFAFDANTRIGARVAAFDSDGDGNDDLVACAGNGGGPHVRIFNGTSDQERQGFFAFEESFRGGCYVAGTSANF